MTNSSRLRTVNDGQLLTELRCRDLSGTRREQLLHLQHLAELSALIDDVGDCWAHGPTSSGLMCFDGAVLAPPFHLLIERGRNVRRAGHVIHTSERIELIDRAIVDGIPTMSATRTLIDEARTLSPEKLTLALDSALRDGLTSDEFLHRRLAALRGSGRSGVRKLLAVIEGAEITRGGQSFLEREFLRLVHRAGLPRPRTQVVLSKRRDRYVRVDFHFDGTPVIAETLGYRWHRTTAQLAVDTERMNRLILQGFAPLQFTYAHVMDDSARVIDDLRTALRPYLRSLASPT